MPPVDILQWVTLATNLTVIITAIKLIRHVSKLEFKIDILWSQFCKEMNISSSRGD